MHFLLVGPQSIRRALVWHSYFFHLCRRDASMYEYFIYTNIGRSKLFLLCESWYFFCASDMKVWQNIIELVLLMLLFVQIPLYIIILIYIEMFCCRFADMSSVSIYVSCALGRGCHFCDLLVGVDR